MQHIRKLTGLALAVGLAACTDSPASLPTASGVELRAHGAKDVAAVTAGVAPRAAKPYGRTYEAWGGAMLQWLAAIPTASNPYIDETGALTQAQESGRVWFLPGPSFAVSQPQELALTIPAGTAIFFAAFGSYGSGPGGVPGDGDDTPEELLQGTEDLLSLITDVQVSIDGVGVADVAQYRIVSPAVELVVPEDNIWTDLYGEPTPFTFGVFGGYGLFLDPLRPGVHTLHAAVSIPQMGVTFDMTYHITVQAKR